MRYIVHIQSKYNEMRYKTSPVFENIQKAHAWGATECYDRPDLYYYIMKVEQR